MGAEFRVSADATCERTHLKYLDVASLKPELRRASSSDDDIEVVTRANAVLIYDRPMDPETGLRWRDLQAWWAEETDLPGGARATRLSLYTRLQESLPEFSTPHRNFFRAFYEARREMLDDVPALLPMVWRHHRPGTATRHDSESWFLKRIDFLMLLPHGERMALQLDTADQDDGSTTVSARDIAFVSAGRTAGRSASARDKISIALARLDFRASAPVSRSCAVCSTNCSGSAEGRILTSKASVNINLR